MEFKVECTDCKKRFQFEESLVVHHSVCNKHQDRSTSRRPFTCEQCGRSFKSMTSLRNHARTHTDYFDVTKEIFDRTLRSSLDVTTDILESTRTSEANTSTINRSLDISAVMSSDISTNMTFTSETTFTSFKVTPNTTLIEDLANTQTTFIVHKPANETFVCDIIRESKSDNEKLKHSDATITEECANIETTYTVDKHSNETYVCNKDKTDGESDKETIIRLDKTYVWDGERQLSADRTYLVQTTHLDQQIKQCDELPTQTTRAIPEHVTSHSGHVIRRRSGIPVFRSDEKTGTSSQNISSPLNRFGSKPIPSVKYIRTLRASRSKSRTPKKTDKTQDTPTKDRSKSRSRTPKSRGTPKYGTRMAVFSRMDSIRADSPFRLTPLSPILTPRSKNKGTPGANKYKCNKCGKAFINKDQLDIHYVIHVRDTPAKCGIPSDCYKKNIRKLQFTTPDKKVVSVQRSNQSFTCPHCQRSYQSERYLRSHMKVHFIDVPHACSHCDKRFKHIQSLRAHAITHIGEVANGNKDTNGKDVTKCKERVSGQFDIQGLNEDCVSGDFSKVLERVNHSDNLIEKLGDTAAIKELLELPYTCSTCSYKTNQPTNLLKHMQTHSRARPFKCTECDKSYKTRSNLELHGKVHMIGKLKTLLSDRRASVNAGYVKKTKVGSS